MAEGLLLFDIGNTSIKLGFLCGDQHLYTLPTDASQTSDSFGLTLLGLRRHAGVDGHGISACVITSVVPSMNPVVREAVRRFIGCPTFFVPKDLPIPLENHYLRPQEVGADRLVGAYAARCQCPESPSIIVVDFGTAVTFDCIVENAYLGGLIFPGPLTALSALSGATAKLPRINLETDATVPAPGRDTETSIRHGILFGFAGMVESLVGKLADGMPGRTRIIGTGGFAQSIARICPVFDEIRPGLLLEGLELVYRNHTGRSQ